MSDIEVSTRRSGQVFAFVSAKGGTGKTIMAVSTAYYLQRAGKKVALIDTDFSTRGLSLYILGRAVHGSALNFALENCLADSILGSVPPHKIQPRTVVYANVDFEIVVANRDLWRGGVPDDRFLGAAGDTAEQGERRLDRYFQFLRGMCEFLRDTYDYVIMDTRGGYDFTSAAPAAVADGYVVVLEADSVSVDQVGGLIKKLDDFGREYEIAPLLKGFIVNKALFAIDNDLFSQAVQRLYGGTTFGVIPADREAIRAYQKREIPADIAPDSDFAYFSLSAIENLIAPRENWDHESVARFERAAHPIRASWAARHRSDALLRGLPLAHVGLLLLTIASYVLYKYDLLRGALSAFYVAVAGVILGTAVASLLVSFRWVRSLTRWRKVHAVAGSLCLVFWLGLLGMTLDVPRTFSRNELLERITLQDSIIKQVSAQRDEAQRQLASAEVRERFVNADRERASDALTRTRDRLAEAEKRRVELELRAEADRLQSEKGKAASTRPSLTMVPDVTRRSVREAHEILKASGLDVGKTAARGSDAPLGTVLEQDPRAGAQVPRGSDVTLSVSTGPTPSKVPGVTKRPDRESAAPR